MTSRSTTALAEILEDARAAAAAGDSARARHYFRNLTEIDPSMIEAWLGYASCTTVLSERRTLYCRALELDASSPEALAGLASADALLANGKLLHNAAKPEDAAPPLHLKPALPPPLLESPVRNIQVRRDLATLALVGLSGLLIMGTLTMFGIFVLTSFWGFLLAFIAGPAVSELIVRVSAGPRRAPRGRRLQVATGVGMILGGVGAIILGALLLQLLGAPLPSDAVLMAQRIGVGSDPTSVLLNNPGLLIFLSSAIAATIYRLR
jgi:hypothetical protein